MSQAQLKLLIKKQTNQNLEKPMTILEPPRFIQQPPMREFVQPTKANGNSNGNGNAIANAVSPKKLAKIEVPPRTTGTAAEKGSDKIDEMVMKEEKKQSPQKEYQKEMVEDQKEKKQDQKEMEKYQKEMEKYEKELQEDQKQIPDDFKPMQAISNPKDEAVEQVNHEYQDLPGCSSSSSSCKCDSNEEVEMPLPLDNFPSLESLQSSAWKFFSYPDFHPMEDVTPHYMGNNQEPLTETLDVMPLPSYEAPPLDLSNLSLAFDNFSLADLSPEQEMMQAEPHRPPGCSIFGAHISATDKLTEGQKILLQAAVTQPDIPLEDALMAIVLDLRHERLSQEAAAAAAAAASATTYSSYPTNDAQGFPNMHDYSQDSYFSSGYPGSQDQSQNQSQYHQNQPDNSYYSNYQNQPESSYNFQAENAYPFQGWDFPEFPGYDLNLPTNPQSQSQSPEMMMENSMAQQAEQPMPPLAYPMQQQQQSDFLPNLNQPQVDNDDIIPDFIRDFWPELLMSPDLNTTTSGASSML
ncbi:uncharacterized protein [Drosophila takahashii]|uniref:uncharacterized protein n=1 Tax=Drosophila takahashii TaxID=29030 RepID=UPI001CF84BBA|nr:uncharacterized protein LOC123002353 [Drosophila takahashii]